MLIWRAGVDKKCEFINRSWLEFTGRTVAQELGHGWLESVHPDDVAGCIETYGSAFDARRAFRMECRLRRADGVYRWMMTAGAAAKDHPLCRYIGSSWTWRTQAMERLSGSQRQQRPGRLIDARSESTHIARELHDNINQQLAGLAVAERAPRRSARPMPDWRHPRLQERGRHRRGRPPFPATCTRESTSTPD
jgi:PAS domain-containing protein